MSERPPLNPFQLRRKGRNGYVASDVDTMIAHFKRELADAHEQAYNARLHLQRARQAALFMPPPPPAPYVPPAAPAAVAPATAVAAAAPAIDMTDANGERRRLINEIATLEQARNSLIGEITQRRLQLADLDEALVQRRNEVTSVAEELLRALGPPLPTIDLDQRTAGADLFA